MREWVDEFLAEIQGIEIFFNTKFEEYSQELEILKDTFYRKKNGNQKKLIATSQEAMVLGRAQESN